MPLVREAKADSELRLWLDELLLSDDFMANDPRCGVVWAYN
jgi:hypothetical protein